MEFKSGFVAIIGKPNVGKSTLINSLLKEKVAIVSPKPQTTRDKILGILNEKDYQIIFIDTPGIHNAKNKLDEYMSISILEALKGVDVLLIVLDGSKKITDADINFIKRYEKFNNVIVVVNKTDLTNYEKLYPQIAKLNDLAFVKHIIPLSAYKNFNIDVLKEKIKSLMPVGVKYYDTDIYTDKPVKFLVAEIIREKALWLLQEEVPHGIAVDILTFKENAKGVNISADLICEKHSHKIIIIGKNGTKLREIGTKSRLEIEKLLNKTARVNLFVKVREDWRNNNTYVKGLGYNKSNL